jgi:hypothetical protein
MSDLLTKYEESAANNVVKARLQSEGDDSVAVNVWDVNKSYSRGFVPNLTDEPVGRRSEFNEGIMEEQYTVELGKIDQQYTGYNRDNRYIDNNPNLPGVVRSSK